MTRRLFAALLVVAWALPLAAQEPDPPDAEGTAADTTAATDEQTALATIPVDLSSPRATLSTFLETMNAVTAGRDAEWAGALACINLDEVPEAERASVGRALATRLFESLDTVTIDFQRVPESSEERNVRIEVGQETPIPLDFRLNDDGQWRFSRTRLAEQIDEVEQRVQDNAVEASADLRVNPDLATPRMTMRTFMEGMANWERGGRERALSTLDLSQFGDTVREEIGAAAATQIKRILDRDRTVIFQEIPNEPAGNAYVHLVDRSDSAKELKIEIVPVPVDDSGEVVEWKFSAATVANSNALWDVYKDRAVITGVEEQQPLVLSVRMRDWVDARFPFLLDTTVFLENWQWLGLLAIILFGMAASRLFGFILIRIVRRVFSRERLALDTKLERDFVRPIRIALMAWVWFLALRPLGLPGDALAVLKSAAGTISAIAAVWAAYRLVDIVGGYLSEKANRTHNRFDDLVVPLVVRSLKVFVVVFGLVFVAEVNDWDYRTALAGVGLGGLAFALAAKDTLGNVFGSLTILLDKPFQIGDWVTVGEADGTVESVGMRSTRIRTFYNSLISVPNATLINSTIDNWGARRYRRTSTMLSLTYDTPPEKIEAFCEGVRELIRQHPHTRKDYFHVYLNQFAGSSLEVMLYCFHECPDWGVELQERHRLYLDILRLANRLGVEFAFPTQTLHVQASEGQNGHTALSKQGDPGEMGRQAASAVFRSSTPVEAADRGVHVPGIPQEHLGDHMDDGE